MLLTWTTVSQDVTSLEQLQQLALFGGLSQGSAAAAYTISVSPTLSGRQDIQPGAVCF